LLEATSASVDLAVEREKRPTDPVETLLVGTGRLEPTQGRGEMRYDLTGLFATPDTSPPTSPTIFDVTWTPDDLWARADASAEWQKRTRDEARSNGGLLGRLPDEVDGLLRVIAESDAGAARQTGSEELDGQSAERWTVVVPIEDLAARHVPADTPYADVLRRIYGIDAVPVEVWLVDGGLRRLRYAFAREQAPYGGPDQTTTTYDVLATTNEPPIELPD
jgi:hypothetical protein